MPHPSGIPYVNLEVKRSIATDNQVGYKYNFKAFDNNVVLDNFRILVYFTHRWAPSDIVLDSQDGYLKSGGLSDGKIEVDQPIDILEFFVPVHPPAITDLGSFRNQFRIKLAGSNFNSGSGTRNYLNDGEGIGDLELKIHQTNYKKFAFEDGIYNYDKSYSKESSTSYVDTPSFLLQYNDVDPNNPDSHNWALVPEVIDNTGTPDPSTGVYPENYIPDYLLYASDLEAGYPRIGWATTEQDMIFIEAMDDAQIRSTSPNTNYSSDFKSTLTSNTWDGLGNANYREVLAFDLTPLIGKVVLKSLAVTWINNDNITTNGNVLSLHDMGGSVDETTATWSNQALNFDTKLDEYIFGSNAGDSNRSYGVWDVNTIPVEVSGNAYLGIKWDDESKQSTITIGTRRNTIVDKRPHLLIKYDPNSDSPEGTGLVVNQPIEVDGDGQRLATNDGSGIVDLPPIDVQGIAQAFKVVQGNGIIELPAIQVNGLGTKIGVKQGGGDISLPSIEVDGLGSLDGLPIISYISNLEGRWNEEITMIIENLPASFAITLDGIEVEILSVNGKEVVWIVPEIAIGPRNLRIIEL